MTHQALSGLKVIDAATMIAAPWSATYLAEFGADVIKVEHPKKGCTARTFGKHKDGQSVLWDTLNRNKRSLTLNLGEPQGQELFKQLVIQADVVIENYRPGTMEKWGLGYEDLKAINPSLIMLRTTGYGQEGPYSDRGGFGTVAESMSGFTSVNGPSDGPPTLPGIALADGVAGYAGALAIMIALYERDRNPDHEGQMIDLSIYEPLMRLMDAHLCAYDQLGLVAGRNGNRSLTSAPRNAYLTKDSKWLALSASNQPIVEKLFAGMGMSQLLEDPRFSSNDKRMEHVEELDAIIGDWMKQRNLDEIIDSLSQCGAVVGPMYDVSQVFDDPHFKFRQSFIPIKKGQEVIQITNVFAKFSRTPGEVRHIGPSKGEHTDEILSNKLGITLDKLEDLRSKDII